MNERPEDATSSHSSSSETTERTGQVWIDSEDDILRARQQARDIAEDIDFSITDVTRIVTAVSELARNIHLYADQGVMEWRELSDGTRTGLELTFDDDGPGIDDVDAVLRAEYSTSDGMGRGIQGTRKLMDDFDLTSSAEDGTTITIRKWH
jgi:serine/threonine-protein kinase RsbT